MAGILKYTDLLPEAKGVAPLCPDNELLFQFRRAFAEFTEISKAWLAWVDIPEVEDQQTYTIAPPFNADVLDILEVRLRATNPQNDFDFGTPVHPSTWRFNRVSTNPRIVTSWTPGESSERNIRVQIVMTPSSTAAVIDDVDFFGRWNRAVLAKALYETLKMPGKPWRNELEAAERRKEYWNLVGDAKREATLSQYGANQSDGMTG